MTRFFVLLFSALCLLPSMAVATLDLAPIENVARTYATVQPELKTYQVDLETSKFGEMLARMTANMPPEVPRPATPLLRKYWSRSTGTALIRAEGQNVFPYMQEMVERFSSEFAVDLRSLFIPLAAAEARRKLLKDATAKVFETRLGESRILDIELVFPTPVDLGGAFYEEGLDLPQRSIKALTLELDPDLAILNRLEITAADSRQLTVEIRHESLPGGYLPREIRITAPDGSIDDRFVTTFSDIEGYRLPGEQVRTIHRPGREETLTVLFSNYRLNAPLPEEVVEQMKKTAAAPESM